MSTANPYAPPTAHVTDVDGEGRTQPLRISTYKGRIGRLRLMAWTCGAYFVMGFIGVLGGVLGGATGLPRLVNVVVGIATIVFLLFWVFWTIQRSHDMGWSGWTWLWVLVPFVGLIWVFKAGDPGSNRYGAPPPPNTGGVHVLAWLLPAIAVLGILAAIALPAYQDYTKRAKASQVQRL